MAVREFKPVIRQFTPIQRETDAERIARHGWQPFVACSFCGDTGHDPDTGRECEVCVVGTQLIKRASLETMWPTIIPRRFVNYTLEDHPNSKLAQDVGAWIDSNPCMTGENLVIQGGTGRGKTGAAIGALRELHFHGAIVRYWFLPDLMDQLRAENDPNRKDDSLRKRPTMEWLTDCDVLLLDDMGTERQNAYVQDRLHVIFDGRYVANRPTILTTNYDGDQWKDYLGSRIYSRLTENVRYLKAVGPDLRGKK